MNEAGPIRDHCSRSSAKTYLPVGRIELSFAVSRLLTVT